MVKKILAVVLILALGASIMWFANPLGSLVKASADSYKGGFAVTATKYDDSGIALDTHFILSSQNPVTLDYLKENLSIRGEAAPGIASTADGTYEITPAAQLLKNKLYIIDIKTRESGTVSFAFQTPKDFSIIGNLPENMSTGVPVDTGIELYFSYPDVSGLDNYFEISPAVQGRFEYHGYTVSFVPQKLDPGTVYTVTVKQGLKAGNGIDTLAADYSFSFETAPDSSVTADPKTGSLVINNNWFDFSTLDTPAIPFDIYMTGSRDLKNVEVTARVYQFPDMDSFLKAVTDTEKYPTWAWYSYSTHKTDVSSLNKALEFKQSFNLEQWQSKYMMFPEKLKDGFYIIELSSGELTAQAFVQISDIASFMMEDKNSRLFWVNNLLTGSAENGAEILDLATGKSVKTNDKGIATLEGASQPKDDKTSSLDLYKITSASGKTAVLNTGYAYGTRNIPENNPNLYWRYIQTDRTLYKPSDTVEFWGFIKSRVDGSSPSAVTVDISEGGFYPMFSKFMQCFLPIISKPLETVTLNTDGGFFDGNMALPALDPGSYTLTVKSGDQVLATSYISVENYIKPQYKIDITSDKKAVFAGEKVTFTIQASFFDGTPVSNVPIRYDINGWNSNKQGNGTTDAQGRLKVEYVPEYTGDMLGECYFSINATATLPETGEVSQYESFMVFSNDIVLQPSGEIKDGKATVKVQANKVVLDTLNDSDLTNDNYVGDAVPGKQVDVRVYKISWEKIETGTDYDFINKVVRKTYDYREKRELALDQTITTDAQGKASLEFPTEAGFEGYYTATITAIDSNGRNMHYETGIYDSGKQVYPQYGNNYYLKTDKDNYAAGETVNVGFYNNETPVSTAYRTLFVESRNGILGYDVKGEPKYSKAFDESLSPNYYVNGVLFNGKSYIQSNCIVPYKYDEKKLTITVETDKESYKPGDECTVHIKTVDKDGKPVAARVNISLVDEALLKLSGQYIDPLGYLYSWMDSGILRYSTNRSSYPVYYGGRGGGVMDGNMKVELSGAMAAPAPAATAQKMENGANFDTTAVRSDFRDTACFQTVALDKNGEGSLTFKLPDNITSFSLAAAAISSDLHAGSEVTSTKVSMPFFVSDSLSAEYLSGDTPYIGVTAYGQELKENENVTFEVRCKELNYTKSVTAKAFERVNIPLPKLNEGTYNVEIYAGSGSGLTDAVKRTIQVYGSYRTIETSTLKKLAEGVSVDAGKSGLTTLIFTDESRASIINALHGLSWSYGHRLDQKLVAMEAQKLLKEIVNSDELYFETIDLDSASYRNDDGGYGILPYSESDMKLTALLAPYLKDTADAASLKMYFYNAVLSSETINPAALYGLAVLGEPVMTDLEKARDTENLSLTDYMLIGMAYEALGDTSIAQEIYSTRIQSQIERKDPYIRVKVKNNDTDASLEQTALLAAFTSGLGMDESAKMYAYISNNYSKNVYTGIETLMYLKNRLNNLPDEKVGFTYSYNGRSYTVDLSDGRSELVKIPSVKASSFKVTGVNGSASVLSLFMAPLNQNVANDSNISMTRKYYNALTNEEMSTFSQNDIVRVEITYDIKKAAMDNVYEISDYAPSGLKPINNPWQYGINTDIGFWYRSVDGQKVTFVVGKNFEKKEPLVYYARVASPGEYTAEGTVAQGSIVKSSLTVNGNTMIKILP